MAIAWRHLTTLASLATPLALPVERLEGRLHGSNAPVVMAFAGAPVTADFVADSLLSVERRTPVGRISNPLGLRSATLDRLCSGADLAAIEVPYLWRFCLPADMPLQMPAWVSQEIRSANDSPIVLPTELRKEVTRHQRREGYELAFSHAPADIRRFYAELYRPYVKARFQAGAVLVDENHFLEVSRGMTLAILRADRGWAAGMLFRQRGMTLQLGWFGSISAPPPAGASEVLDAGVIEHAAALGVRRVVMGHSRPSLADGVLRYKSRFGATVRPTRFPQRVIGLGALQPSAALAASLNAARFVMFRNGHPVAYELQL
jgi:hypothetical protein